MYVSVASLHVCTPLSCLVPKAVGRGHRISLKWSYRCFLSYPVWVSVGSRIWMPVLWNSSKCSNYVNSSLTLELTFFELDKFSVLKLIYFYLCLCMWLCMSHVCRRQHQPEESIRSLRDHLQEAVSCSARMPGTPVKCSRGAAPALTTKPPLSLHNKFQV